MVNFISSWVQGIIVAVVIATIIEMILPNGNSKKYIKVVIGVYVIFNIIAPIINKMSSGKFDSLFTSSTFEKYIIETDTYKPNTENIQNSNNGNIRDIYISSLKNDILSRLKDKGYKVSKVDIDIKNDEEYTINKIVLTITGKETEDDEEIKENNISNINNKIEIEDVNISIVNENNKQDNINNENKSTINNINESQKKEIKEYLSNIYEVKTNNIYIN